MRATSLIALLPAVLLVSACGGDSSSDDVLVLPSTSPPVSGRAVKGVAQHAEVLAYQRVGGSWSLAGSTVTDDEGYFTFANGLPKAVIKLVVQPTGDGMSRLVCDAARGCGDASGDPGDVNLNDIFDFGESMPMPENFTLAATLPAARVATATVAVSPATHLMTAYIERMPGEPNDDVVAMARRQIAGVLALDDDFAWRAPIDITDPEEVADASAEALHHAVLSAAFAQLGGATPEVTLGTYAYRYAGLAGQLPVSHGASIQQLAGAAHSILDHLDTLPAGVSPDAGTAIDDWAGSWPETVTDMALLGNHDPADLARARTSLLELDKYLRDAGIDESATFAETQLAQFDWMYNESMLGLLEVMFESVYAVIQVSIQASILEQEEDRTLPATINYLMMSPELSAEYTFATRRLVITGETDSGQAVDVTFGITLLPSGLEDGTLEFEVIDGKIENEDQTGMMNGILSIVFENETAGLVDSLMGTPDPEALATFLENLHVRASISGSASLADSTDPDKALAGEIDAWAEINVPALQNDQTFIQVQITSGHGQTPNGDELYSLPGEEPALHIAIDDSATLQAAFGFEAFGLPAMQVRADGALNGLDALVASFIGDLATLGNVDPLAIVSLLMELDVSLLDIEGEGSLDIPDDGKHWDFVLDGNRFDATQPNSTENALSFYLTSLEGGFIYSGGQPVAAVTIDWLNLGAAIYSVDGRADHYYGGSVEELLAPLLPLLP